MKKRNNTKIRTFCKEKKTKKEINTSNISFKKIYSYNEKGQNIFKDSEIIDIIELNDSYLDDNNYRNKKKKNFPSRGIRIKKIKEEEKIELITLDDSQSADKTNEVINTDFKPVKSVKNKIMKKSKKNKNKDNSSEKITIYEISDKEKNDSSIILENNIIINDSSENYSSKFISLKISNDSQDDNDKDKNNENPRISRKSKKTSFTKNKEQFKFLNKKREKEKYVIEKKEEFEKHPKRKKLEPIISKSSFIKNKKRSKSFYKNFINQYKSIKKEKRLNKENLSPEIKMLYYLLKEYGIENAVNSAYNSDNFKNNNFDSFLNDIKEKCGENKLIIMLIKSLIVLIKENLGDIIPNEKRPVSVKNYSLKYKNKYEDYKNVNSGFNYQQNLKNSNEILDEKANNNEFEESDENNNIKIESNDKTINNNNESNIESNISNNIDSNINSNIDIDEIKEREDRVWSIESHYNKYKDGNIYKYEVGFLYGKSVIFRCYDHRCNSKGIFDLETKEFKVQKEHNLKNEEHNYVVNNEANNDLIFKEMIENNYLDAQVYKEGKSLITRFYY